MKRSNEQCSPPSMRERSRALGVSTTPGTQKPMLNYQRPD
jgi:hypothetical protein